MNTKLRIWHNINIPGEAFRFDVPNPETALKALDAIAAYDLFLGDGTDKPMTTVGARQAKRDKLAGRDRLMRRLFKAYNEYQLVRCPGGVPLVATNVQGLEQLEIDEDGKEDWCEYYDDDGNDIDELRQMAKAS